MADLRVMVIDDEPLVRNGITKFLKAQSGIELTEQAGDGIEAVRLIEQSRPDLIFLDVQMPEMNGFEVLACLDKVERPAVVFVTAYDRYALKAFEVHAIDYLLKPFDENRLQEALSQVRARLEDRSNGFDDRLSALLTGFEERKNRIERFMVRSGGRIYFVDVDEVSWLEAADNYVRLHAGEKRHLIRDTIKNLEARLDPERFVRIHRSAMINVKLVAEMRPLASGDCDLILKDGTELRVSRSYRESFEKNVMGG